MALPDTAANPDELIMLQRTIESQFYNVTNIRKWEAFEPRLKKMRGG